MLPYVTVELAFVSVKNVSGIICMCGVYMGLYACVGCIRIVCMCGVYQGLYACVGVYGIVCMCEVYLGLYAFVGCIWECMHM